MDFEPVTLILMSYPNFVNSLTVSLRQQLHQLCLEVSVQDPIPSDSDYATPATAQSTILCFSQWSPSRGCLPALVEIAVPLSKQHKFED